MAFPYTFEDGFEDNRSEIERAFDIYIWENGFIQDCEVCPFFDSCSKEELFWGCGVWESEMGEDL